MHKKYTGFFFYINLPHLRVDYKPRHFLKVSTIIGGASYISSK